MAIGLPKASLASSTIVWSWELGLLRSPATNAGSDAGLSSPSLHDPGSRLECAATQPPLRYIRCELYHGVIA